MPNIESVSSVRPIIPHRDAPAAAARVPISDSLGIAEESAPSLWTPERPALSHPDAVFRSEYRLLAATDESRNLGNEILELFGEILQSIKLKIHEISAENIEKLKEVAQKVSESNFWSVLKKIATALLSSLSVVFGIALISSGGGALIGGAMIASGILSLANFALTESGVWNWVAEELSNDNEEMRQRLAVALPGTVGIVAGGIGLAGTVMGVASGVQFAEKAIYSAQTMLAIFDGLTTIGKGSADANLTWSEASVSNVQALLTVARTQFDSVMKEIQGFINDSKILNRYTKKIVQTVSQSNIQLVRQA